MTDLILKLLLKQVRRLLPDLATDEIWVKSVARGVRLPQLEGRWILDLRFRRQGDDDPEPADAAAPRPRRGAGQKGR